ncbi:MAG TPA: NAD(P)-dependent oxidoreductase, partial [Stellaceae bacterium]|nr:NAD(P)-dependent oxidoreductase [Stellaceae bacterium]
NYRAVAEHAMALILALSRRLPEARDNQAKRVWRGMIGDLSRREDELGGKMLLVVGLGQIGGRLAELAKGFDMRVVGLRRDPTAGRGAADAVHAMGEFKSLLPEADFVALTCPLTKETEKLVDAEALVRMKPSAYLVNVARGRVVDEAALVEALAARRIAGAGIDVTVEEPLAPNSPLWGMEHVLLTPHTAGETRRYEDNVIEILRDNLGRLQRGEEPLRNQMI